MEKKTKLKQKQKQNQKQNNQTTNKLDKELQMNQSFSKSPEKNFTIRKTVIPNNQYSNQNSRKGTANSQQQQKQSQKPSPVIYNKGNLNNQHNNKKKVFSKNKIPMTFKIPTKVMGNKTNLVLNNIKTQTDGIYSTQQNIKGQEQGQFKKGYERQITQDDKNY
ncbi:hypothetical protein PPERSA_08036 [Pseudocohnilembus persalinus]|uniref:Uncharacterized protein n=1 Tax=Pseudocohnilembus persalinus TaxID=266149 RepID=A0A0V0R3F7_PSEPJ|nr:hypothetical protein PPERSA_08036 [Pseudocohnilembus persalinus]|eukprot:KRX08725.1 hypothetical protein PPERSA_08036 [Pseudocohnilembus persalinus]